MNVLRCARHHQRRQLISYVKDNGFRELQGHKEFDAINHSCRKMKDCNSTGVFFRFFLLFRCWRFACCNLSHGAFLVEDSAQTFSAVVAVKWLCNPNAATCEEKWFLGCWKRNILHFLFASDKPNATINATEESLLCWSIYIRIA